MIIVMKHYASQDDVNTVVNQIETAGLSTHISQGAQVTIIGVVGDKSRLSSDCICSLPNVEKIVPITESYKLANVKFHPAPTEIKIGNHTIGGKQLLVMAGPCAVESREQLLASAEAVQAGGGTVLRGGAYKPRTSPYAFQEIGRAHV